MWNTLSKLRYDLRNALATIKIPSQDNVGRTSMRNYKNT